MHIDLIEWVDFDRDFFHASLRALNPYAPVLEVSCRTRDGISTWTKWLLERAEQMKTACELLNRNGICSNFLTISYITFVS